MSTSKGLLSASVGAISGVFASLAAVSSSGAVSGLSIPGIASGLHALGALVGATSVTATAVAGLTVVATIPVAMTATTYGAYRYFENKSHK